MKVKDGDQLIGIYELTAPGGFANEAAIKAFTLAFHEYGSYYIKQLGIESGSADLEKQGEALRSNLGAKLDDLSPVRETMMWQKIKGAKGYLLVGMGDAHRQALEKRLDAAGIPHARVDLELVKQKDAIKKAWAPWRRRTRIASAPPSSRPRRASSSTARSTARRARCTRNRCACTRTRRCARRTRR
jgi:hypothetical protein